MIASWPASVLSPNSREHWAKRARVKKEQRLEWYALAMSERMRAPREGKIAVRLEFVAGDRRPRDADNLLASCKAGLDGLADALGVNDSRFRITFDMAEPVKGGACVKVSVSPEGIA